MFVPSLQIYNVYLLAAARVDSTRVQKLFETLEEMRAKGVEPNAMSYNAILRHCARNSSAQGAATALRLMDDAGVQPNAPSFTNAISAMLGGGNPRGALDQLDAMRKAGFTKKDLASHAVQAEVRAVYQELMSSVCRRRGHHHLKTVIGYLAEDDYNVDAAVAGDVFLTALDAGDYELCLSAVRLLAAAKGEKTYMNVCEGELHTALRLAARKGNLVLAEETWTLAQWRTPVAGSGVALPISALLYLALIDVYVSAGETRKAFAVLGQLCAALPECDQNPVVFSGLVESLSLSVQKVDEAYFILSDLHATDPAAVSAAAVNCVMAACVRVGDMGRAFETFVELERSFGLSPTTEVYNTLMEACWRNGHPETVPQLLDEMKKKGLSANESTFSHVLDAHIVRKEYEQGLELLKQCRESRPVVMASRDSAVRLLAGARRDRKHELLKELKYAIGNIFGYQDLRRPENKRRLMNRLFACRDDDVPKQRQDTAKDADADAGMAGNDEETKEEDSSLHVANAVHTGEDANVRHAQASA